MARLTTDFAWLLASRAGVMGVGLVTGGIINRALGPAGRGVLAEMQTWVGLFAVLCGLSLDSALYHFANRERYGDDDRARLRTAAALSLALATLGAGALATFARLVPGQVSPETAAHLPALCLLLGTTMLASNLTVFFQAAGRVPLAAVLAAAPSAAYLALLLAGAARGRIDLPFVIAALLVVQVLTVALAAAGARHAGLGGGAFSGALARGILGAGARIHVGAVATFLYLKANQIFVLRTAGAGEAGLFAAALNLSFAFSFVPTAFQSALYPRVIHGADDFEITVRALRVAFWGWGAVSLALGVLAEPLLLLYGGGEFRSAAGMLRVLLVASWLLPLTSLLAPYTAKLGAFFLASTSAVALGGASIALNLVLIPRFAGFGAAIATAATCAIGFAMGLGMFAYLGRRNPLPLLLGLREARTP